MDAYDFFFPGLGIGFVLVNIVSCVICNRRIRAVEARVANLEARAISAALPNQEEPPVQPTAPSQYSAPITYAQPPAYTFYQQPPVTQAYYPQDPQIVYR